MAMLVASASYAQTDQAPSQGGQSQAVKSFTKPDMPPGFQILESELAGPVFANAKSETLYTWPQKNLRNGYSGEAKGQVACYDVVQEKTAGLMSPYPPGVWLPELDKRLSCTDLWPPVLADEDAEPVGKWTILTGDDDRRQWAYDEQPVYTSILDTQPGDTFGGLKGGPGGSSPAEREPVGPPEELPANFNVRTTVRGLMLTTNESYSVYSLQGETPENLTCVDTCTQLWTPILAPELAQAIGRWSILQRAPGVKQWVFDGQPVYTYTLDPGTRSLNGSDVPGWNNVYTHKAPSPPPEFTVQTSIAGEVLADSQGKTIYVYNCGDDSIDQLSCDHPDRSQVYRLAICGGGDQQRCMENWPYVLAEAGATGTSRTWSVMQIDPKTGNKAKEGDPDALNVWAYRDRPVYTYVEDKAPGDVNGDGIGEWRGYRNGLKAFWLRNAFFGG